MLRHRLLDITFVINRAVVFAAVSSIVVGIFVILETLLAKYVEASNHITSTVVQLAVALCLGLGARTIHARVDRFVDDVFFRERHDAEAALRAFAYDAPLITDEETLLRRTRENVLRYAQATSADVWLRDGKIRSSRRRMRMARHRWTKTIPRFSRCARAMSASMSCSCGPNCRARTPSR